METEFDFEVYWAGKDVEFETLDEAMRYAMDMTYGEYNSNRDVAYVKKRYHNHCLTTSVRWIGDLDWDIEDFT